MKHAWIIGGIGGAAIGAALGYGMQCAGGLCRMMATPWRGAFLGALIGLLFVADRHVARTRKELRRDRRPRPPMPPPDAPASRNDNTRDEPHERT